MEATTCSKKPRKVNQTLVAERLNVSVATVSKALRGMSDIGEETVRKVQMAAREIGYDRKTKNGIGDLANTECGFIGVLVNKSTYPASRGGYFEGLSKEAVARNMSLVSHYASKNECKYIIERSHQPWVIRNNAVKGLVLIHHWPEEIVNYLSKLFPCVSIMHQYDDPAVGYVGVDSSSAIGKLMDMLYEAGHRNIGFFGHNGAISWSRRRFAAYTESLCRLGLAVNSQSIVEVEQDYPEKGGLDWEKHFDYVASQIRAGVTAWMCPSDLAGHELYTGLTRRGFSVPRDVSITGFDSSSMESSIRLTSVKVRSVEMGVMALKMLLMDHSGYNMPRQVVKLDCDIALGETVAGLKT
ncbi:HTH-type transcriptional repressor CytR [Limihaloglobus sulfuriphilus]|uniref:HTH-type transcriptional repressor CytR n=1 Tax=Limihaloglobus sulfuriphilus TaxID=1851148 RepID=A0A1Q2MDZ9_9BACT|nr:LacI family DNA-binding transcriptional regulator [Limihaloglobus sulfuriphilus]AQQ70933.1 HTH-type transcriptional repressor CytR [Limihaloglobus sulfuriphilus]